MLPKAETVISCFERTMSTDKRKATGAYYTNSEAVDKVLDAVLLPTLENRTPQNVPQVLDPAAGAGAFLVRAYRRLLQWSLEWYIADGAEKWAEANVLQALSGEWHLTLSERSRILQESIRAIEVNPAACDVCHLALHLVMYEDVAQLLSGAEAEYCTP